MANLLQFTLGLEAHDFLHKIGLSSASILRLSAVAEGLHFAFERTFQAIEKGSALEHLSKRTGESAGNLYQLQAGFKAAGLGAEDVGSALFFMNKSLGGVNEMGERTENSFRRLGLSTAALKSAGGVEAMQKILEALRGLNQESATKAASMIFGRMQPANMVQLAHSTRELADGMQAAAGGAETFQRNAAAFAFIERSLTILKEKFTALWAVVAEKAVNAFGIIFEAFETENLSELIGLALQVGFEKGSVYAAELAIALGAGLITAVPAALKAAFKLAIYDFEGAVKAIGEAVTEGMSTGKLVFGALPAAPDSEAAQRLRDLSAAMLGKFRNRVGANDHEAPGTGIFNAANTPAHRTEGNLFEKMGFVMGAGSTDHQRRTADNTGMLVDLTRQLLQTQIPSNTPIHAPL